MVSPQNRYSQLSRKKKQFKFLHLRSLWTAELTLCSRNGRTWPPFNAQTLLHRNLKTSHSQFQEILCAPLHQIDNSTLIGRAPPRILNDCENMPTYSIYSNTKTEIYQCCTGTVKTNCMCLSTSCDLKSRTLNTILCKCGCSKLQKRRPAYGTPEELEVSLSKNFYVLLKAWLAVTLSVPLFLDSREDCMKVL